MKHLDDDQLIERIRRDDQQAFAILVERYEQKVATTVINMLGHGDSADDVGQEVFIRFFQNIGQFRGQSSLGTYLTKIAINLSLNELKRRQVRNSRFFFWISRNDEDGKQELDLPENTGFETQSDARNLVQAALRHLDPKLRSVVVLRMVEGYDTRETSEILEIPQGTVLSRLSRGQEKLKEILIQLGYPGK